MAWNSPEIWRDSGFPTPPNMYKISSQGMKGFASHTLNIKHYDEDYLNTTQYNMINWLLQEVLGFFHSSLIIFAIRKFLAARSGTPIHSFFLSFLDQPSSWIRPLPPPSTSFTRVNKSMVFQPLCWEPLWMVGWFFKTSWKGINLTSKVHRKDSLITLNQHLLVKDNF